LIKILAKDPENRPSCKDLLQDSFMISAEKDYDTYIFNQTGGSLSSLISTIKGKNLQPP